MSADVLAWSATWRWTFCGGWGHPGPLTSPACYGKGWGCARVLTRATYSSLGPIVARSSGRASLYQGALKHPSLEWFIWRDSDHPPRCIASSTRNLSLGQLQLNGRTAQSGYCLASPTITADLALWCNRLHCQRCSYSTTTPTAANRSAPSMYSAELAKSVLQTTRYCQRHPILECSCLSCCLEACARLFVWQASPSTTPTRPDHWKTNRRLGAPSWSQTATSYWFLQLWLSESVWPIILSLTSWSNSGKSFSSLAQYRWYADCCAADAAVSWSTTTLWLGVESGYSFGQATL